MTPVFRYVVMNSELNYAYQIETNKFYKVGEEFEYYDYEDRKLYTVRVQIFEGTVYNKTKEQVAKEKEMKKEVAA